MNKDFYDRLEGKNSVYLDFMKDGLAGYNVNLRTHILCEWPGVIGGWIDKNLV